MPRPIDDHGGPVPPSFHTRFLADEPNRVFLFIRPNSDTIQFMKLYESLKLNDVAGIFYMIPQVSDSLPRFHPLVHYISSMIQIDEFVANIQKQNNIDTIFYTILSEDTLIHPHFWSILATAKPGQNYTYLDEIDNVYTLYSMTKDGKAAVTNRTDRIAAYATANQTDLPRIKDAVQHGLARLLIYDLPELTIDTSTSYTPLCQLATKYMTDKSPYNIMTHRHPYTAIYDTFLRPFQQFDTLKFGEIGVLNGSSIQMWRDYFPRAELHGFDVNESYIQNLSHIYNTKGHIVDAGDSKGLRNALQKACLDGKKFDVLLEDASHWLTHQLIFLREAIQFVRPGGLLIIEDIFREIPAARFKEAIQQVSDKIQNAILIRPEHMYRFSPGWENDRILFVWVR